MTKHLGISIFTGKKETFLEELKENVKNGKKTYAVTPNPEIYLEVSKNLEFKKILENSTRNLPDGFGLVVGSFLENEIFKLKNCKLKKVSGFSLLICEFVNLIIFVWYFLSFFSVKILNLKIQTPISNRICGSDIFLDLCSLAEKNSWPIYLAGGASGSAIGTRKVLEKKFPKIKILGIFDGKYSDAVKFLETEFKKKSPVILFSAFGMFKQEKLIFDLQKKTGLLFGVGIGGTFEFVSGKIKRAPKIFRKLGIEWLWRLFLQPKRIGRIYRAIFSYLGLVFKTLKNKNL